MVPIGLESGGEAALNKQPVEEAIGKISSQAPPGSTNKRKRSNTVSTVSKVADEICLFLKRKFGPPEIKPADRAKIDANPYSFESVQDELVEAISKLPPHPREALTLFNGFVCLGMFDKVDAVSIALDKPRTYLPMVMCLGKETGQVYYFPVKTLIPGFGKK